MGHLYSVPLAVRNHYLYSLIAKKPLGNHYWQFKCDTPISSLERINDIKVFFTRRNSIQNEFVVNCNLDIAIHFLSLKPYTLWYIHHHKAFFNINNYDNHIIYYRQVLFCLHIKKTELKFEKSVLVLKKHVISNKIIHICISVLLSKSAVWYNKYKYKIRCGFLFYYYISTVSTYVERRKYFKIWILFLISLVFHDRETIKRTALSSTCLMHLYHCLYIRYGWNWIRYII